VSAAFPSGYTLKDLEQLVLQRNVGIEASSEKINEAIGQMAETRSRFGPEFTSHYSRYPSGGNLPEEEENNQHWLSVGLRQDIFQLFKVRPGRIKEMNAGIYGAEAVLDETKLMALYELREQYLDLVEEKVLADYNRMLHTLFQNQFEVQNTLYLHQAALLPDLLLAQKNMIEAESAHQFHLINMRRQKALLANRLGIEPGEIVIDHPEILISLLPEQTIADLAISKRGMIVRLEANAMIERARASTSAYEDIRMSSFLGYRLRGDRLSGLESGLAVSLTFSMPLRFRGIKNNRYDRFKARERYWQLEAEKARYEIKNEIHRVYSEYVHEVAQLDAADRTIALYGERERILQLRIDNPVSSIESGRSIILGVKADLVSQRMEKEIVQCRINRCLFELLYLAGLEHPEEIAHEIEYTMVTDNSDQVRWNGNGEIVQTVTDKVGNPWAVQVASFSTEEEARTTITALQEIGYNAMLDRISSSSEWIFRVMVGFYSTREEALETGKKISMEFGNQDVWVMILLKIEISSNQR
jgi:outer membrane protein TolC